MIVIVAGVVLVVMLLVRRARRRATLAGLNSSKPTFQLEPPRRRISGIRGERL